MLRREGFDTREAATAEEMWAALAERLPDLVILDVNLPDASGFDLCQQLKRDPAYGDLPVVIVSASYVAFDKPQRVEVSGADAFLEQPVIAEDLTATIRNLLQRRGMTPG